MKPGLENSNSFARIVLANPAILAGKPMKCHVFSLAALLLMMCSCANVVTPTGGEKDITPPAIVKTEPDNYTTNFHGESIHLYFDEFVQVKEEGKNLLISPSFKNRPEIRLKGKSVILTFNDTLRRNTTYNFNFGIALQDITEGNPLKNYQFLFSTGASIDSMQIHGIVRNAFTLAPVKDAFVMLYDRDQDSLPFRDVPLYLSKTAEDGTYTLRFIGHGPYKVFVLFDKNSNYMFDGPEEDIGFSEQLLVPDGIVKIIKTAKGTDSVVVIKEGKSVDFLAFVDVLDSTQRVSKPTLVKPFQLVISFRLPLKSPGIRLYGESAELGKDWAIEEWNRRQDTLYLWLNPKLVKDSLSLLVSDGGKILDTLRMDIQNMSRNTRVKKGESADTKAGYTSNTSSQFGLNQDFMITFAYPVKEYDLSKVKFTQNKDSVPIKLVFTDSLKRILSIHRKWNESTTYTLFIPPASITNILGQVNDTILFSWKTKSLKEYGDLKVRLTLKEKGNYLLQLWNNKDIMVRQFPAKETGDFVFDFLDPGVYKLKLVFDKNNNGHWDSGHYLRKSQPEQVAWFSKSIEVRGNWQLEESWELP